MVSYLPKEKQFLVTKNVPCLKRAKSLEIYTEESMVEDDSWVDTDPNYSF
jgi:ubiquitin-like-conjugating enzyme ATG3